MKILVFGALGMLGHKVIQILSMNHEVIGTARCANFEMNVKDIFSRSRIILGVDVLDFDRVEQIVSSVKPDYIINCVGIIKQLEIAANPLISISINSLLPHKLERISEQYAARLIHISTDCVFSGEKGMYKETDIADASDIYGRTKVLGEVNAPHCLTLRTSIVGRELLTRNGLIEWFLQTDEPEVYGYRRALYTGLTTIELARVIQYRIEAHVWLNGVYQVSSQVISKYDLLLLAKNAFNIKTVVNPCDSPIIDRSLDSFRFQREGAYIAPSWPSMIQEMALDPTGYRRKPGPGQ